MTRSRVEIYSRSCFDIFLDPGRWAGGCLAAEGHTTDTQHSPQTMLGEWGESMQRDGRRICRGRWRRACCWMGRGHAAGWEEGMLLDESRACSGWGGGGGEKRARKEETWRGACREEWKRPIRWIRSASGEVEGLQVGIEGEQLEGRARAGRCGTPKGACGRRARRSASGKQCLEQGKGWICSERRIPFKF